MKSLILDANVLVRFLVQDEPKQAAAAAKLMAEAQEGVCELLLDPMIVAETVYVLTSTYKRPRADVANLLLTIIRSPSIRSDQEEELVDALFRFRNTSVDFADAWLATRSAASGNAVTSFDKDLDKFKDVTRHEPKA